MKIPLIQLRHIAVFLLIISLLTPAFGEGPQSSPLKQRPFQVEDLFELEDIGHYFGGPWAFSPDSHMFAFTRVRAKKSLGNYKWEYLWANAGGDVWLESAAGSPPINITNGAQDGSGWWSPGWSPDGQKIAMLSTRGGNVRLWVWDLRKKQLRQLTQRGVDLRSDVHERPYTWVDADHILCPMLPEGKQPESMIIELQTPQIATAEWPKTEKGQEATASVLKSGVAEPLEDRPQSELHLIDINTGTAKTILKGNARSFQISPKHNAIAFTKKVTTYVPSEKEALGFDSSTFVGLATVVLVKLDGTPIVLREPISQDVLEDSLRWSPDGGELAFIGYAGPRTQLPALFRIDIADQTIKSVPLANLDVTPVIRKNTRIEWTADGSLVVLAATMDGKKRPDVMARRDWWLIDKSGKQRCLSSEMKTPPGELWPEESRNSFVGMAEGKIWKIVPEGKIEDLTDQFEGKVVRVAWPSMTNQGTDQYRTQGATYDQIVFCTKESELEVPYLLNLRSRQIKKIEKPAPKADVVAFAPAAERAIFYATDRNGLHVWATDLSNQSTTTLVAANEFLKSVAEGEFKPFDYISLNGEKLRGWLLMPFGYVQGKRYPVITWVYAGSVFKDRPPNYWSINSNLSLNLQIPAAAGYVVLFPSMPLAEEGLTEDPMLRLPEGVLPAVDKVIEMGVADPDRLYLMGQSFGGFSTYGLVTQTQRFHAAVSLAGLSDLVSLYGTLGARDRYTPFAQEDLFMQSLMESAQVGMGNPPWKDLGRYIRNSPIFYVDRVKTPLMIIQGDMDYVAIQQGEEFFTSLYRQGKRAEFVRYWGEGHVLESPANIRDMWKRIFGWLEQFPATNPSESKTEAQAQ